MAIEYVGDDIVVVRRDNGSTWELYWGDPVHRFAERDIPPSGSGSKRNPGKFRIATVDREGNLVLGYIRGDVKLVASSVLRFSMIDVQQGDGMIIETPAGKVIFIDGGDNKLFARHASARYPATTEAKPLLVDAMIITHGDADHFEGLSELKRSESDNRPGKAIFVVPERIYHNGLVKRPDKRPDKSDRKDVDMFGGHKEANGREYATDLVDDPRTVPEAERNGPFNEWCETIDHWDKRAVKILGKPIEISRIDQHSDGFLPFIVTEGLSVELLGPLVESVDGAPALPFLRKPPDDANLMLGDREPAKKGSYSASHTVNGHSINIRLVYKNVRFLMTGDMNQEAMARLHRELPNADLTSEILKAPHHGSADFDLAFLKTVKPVVSLISSGDESLAKEHIHPRATMLAALGKVSRDPFGIIFNTELAAFFKYRGPSVDQKPSDKEEASYEGFERTNFGIIHVRTDGNRVLTFTHSGKKGMNEAYRFNVAADGSVTFAKKVSKISAPAA